MLGAIATLCYPGNAQRAADQAPRPEADAEAEADARASCRIDPPDYSDTARGFRFGRICPGGLRMGFCLVERDGNV